MSALPIADPGLVFVTAPGRELAARVAAQWFAAAEVFPCAAPAGAEDPDPHAELAARVGRRLATRRLAAVAGPILTRSDWEPLRGVSRRHHLPLTVVALCVHPHAVQADAAQDARALQRELRLLEQSLPRLGAQRRVVLHRVDDAAALAGLRLERAPLPCDRSEETGPFDIVGDVHGCADELEELLRRLGYAPDAAGVWGHPAGRRVVFLGDLVDRGPRCLDAAALALAMVAAGRAFCVLGNHDDKLQRYLEGRRIKIRGGLRITVDELEALPPDEGERRRAQLRAALARLPDHLLLDEGRLVVAHGGLREDYIGRVGSAIRAFALYGDATGKMDAHGLPIRRDWAANYAGTPLVVYGHTPNLRPRWVNRTLNVDQGCCFGGALTALRYPELSTVQVRARRVHYPPRGGFQPALLPPPPDDAAALALDPT